MTTGSCVLPQDDGGCKCGGGMGLMGMMLLENSIRRIIREELARMFPPPATDTTFEDVLAWAERHNAKRKAR